MQHISPELPYTSTRLRRKTTQKTAKFIVTTARDSEIKFSRSLEQTKLWEFSKNTLRTFQSISKVPQMVFRTIMAKYPKLIW